MTEDTIPQANQLLFTLKLITGDELLCVMVDEDEHGVLVEDPIIVRMIPIITDDGMSNKLSSAPYMPFASLRMFYFDNADIISLVPMHSSFHKMYVSIVNQYMQTPLVDTLEPSGSSTFVQPVSTLQ